MWFHLADILLDLKPNTRDQYVKEQGMAKDIFVWSSKLSPWEKLNRIKNSWSTKLTIKSIQLKINNLDNNFQDKHSI